jgi:hypothetical protein
MAFVVDIAVAPPYRQCTDLIDERASLSIVTQRYLGASRN